MVNIVKNPLKLLPILAILVVAGCSPYEEGPAVSVNSPEKRIEGTWRVYYATETDEGGVRNVTEDYDDDSFTFLEGGTATHTFSDGSTSVTANGTWQLLNDAETLKLTESWTFLGTTFTNTDYWAIHRLTQKELFLEQTEDDVTTRLEMSAQ